MINEESRYELKLGDCLDVLKEMESNSVDSIATDPPYALTANKKGGSGTASLNTKSPAGRSRIGTGGGFMGKEWDASLPDPQIWVELLRVLKPGGHLIAFGGTRTHHRLFCAIEDAGFEIRDTIIWAFGTGFPKSLNLKEVMPGYGTALKPAFEPICLARKPISEKSIAENVLKYGTGGLNIDGCRVGTTKSVPASISKKAPANCYGKYAESGETKGVGGHDPNLGRFPANLVHDGSDEIVDLFPIANSARASGNPNNPKRGSNHLATSYGQGDDTITNDYRDTGSASRFFNTLPPCEEDLEYQRLIYCAKASRKDRNEGLELLDEKKELSLKYNGGNGFQGRTKDESGNWVNTETPRKMPTNHHPTVKSLSLMRHLVRMVCPPNGIVLDPFMGSGSTGKAAMIEGFRFIGIEREDEYFEIAKARIEHAATTLVKQPLIERKTVTTKQQPVVEKSNLYSILSTIDEDDKEKPTDV